MPSRVEGMRAAAGKALFGLGVFVAIVGGWQQFGHVLVDRTSLPGAGGPDSPCTVWFVGSSSIYRWRTLARDMAPWPVRNRGVDGANVADIAARLRSEKVVVPPDAVVFYIGENDIALGAKAPDVARQLAAMLASARQRMPRVRVLLLGMKPSPARWKFRSEQLRLNALVADLAGRFAGVDYFDTGEALLVGGRPGPYYVDDGIHLNPEGYRRWGGGIRAALERATPPAQLARCTDPSFDAGR